MGRNGMNDERSCQYLSKFLAVINAFIINLLYTDTNTHTLTYTYTIGMVQIPRDSSYFLA